MLIEKAIAKEYEGYDNLEGGATDYALMLITGNPAFRFNLLNDDVQLLVADNSLWKKVMNYSEKGFLMGAGTLPEGELPAVARTLSDSHAYAILDAIEFDGNKLIKLKDPWGSSQWSGEWSQGSHRWTNRMREYIALRKQQKKEQKRKAKPSGEQANLRTLLHTNTIERRQSSSLYISWEDFVKSFEVIFVSVRFDPDSWDEQTIHDKWMEGRAGGSSYHIETVGDNPQYGLTVTSRVEVYCLLTQLIPPARKGRYQVELTRG